MILFFYFHFSYIFADTWYLTLFPTLNALNPFSRCLYTVMVLNSLCYIGPFHVLILILNVHCSSIENDSAIYLFSVLLLFPQFHKCIVHDTGMLKFAQTTCSYFGCFMFLVIFIWVFRKVLSGFLHC